MSGAGRRRRGGSRLGWAWALWLCSCGAEAPVVAAPYFNVPVTCDNFCSTVLRRCRGPWRSYDSVEACAQLCATWPDGDNAMLGRGNSLQCRFLYASMVGYVQDVAAYCLNASPSGGQSCHD